MANLLRRWKVLLSVAAVMALASRAAGQEQAAPFTQDSLRSAADYLKERNGHALLVYHRDKLLFEQYFNGWSAEKPHQLASGTKSFSGAMLAAAAEDGLLTFDEKVADTIVEWKDHPRKSQITIRHLLSLTSGIYGGSTREPAPSYARAVVIADAKFWPGQRFQYGPIPYQVFGELMRRKLAVRGESVQAYMKRRILDPISVKPEGWMKDEDGNILLPRGAFMTAREWAKFGLLVLHRGRWQGGQIVPTKLLQECFIGSSANPYYGVTFWLGKKIGRMPQDIIMANGRGMQILYMLPSLELLIVQLADTERFNQSDFLARLIVGN